MLVGLSNTESNSIGRSIAFDLQANFVFLVGHQVGKVPEV